MVEKLVEIGILFDFYGRLLSERQFLAIELYYIHDLSLGEIGEELNITRQGVFDTLKRAENKLYEFEEKLGLVQKFNSKHDDIKDIIRISKEIHSIAKQNNNSEIQEMTLKIDEIGAKILENSREVVE